MTTDADRGGAALTAEERAELRALCERLKETAEWDDEVEGTTPDIVTTLTALPRLLDALEQSERERDGLREAVGRWWASFRPVEWTAVEHAEHPHVNLTRDAEKPLASIAARAALDAPTAPPDKCRCTYEVGSGAEIDRSACGVHGAPPTNSAGARRTGGVT